MQQVICSKTGGEAMPEACSAQSFGVRRRAGVGRSGGRGRGGGEGSKGCGEPVCLCPSNTCFYKSSLFFPPLLLTLPHTHVVSEDVTTRRQMPHRHRGAAAVGGDGMERKPPRGAQECGEGRPNDSFKCWALLQEPAQAVDCQKSDAGSRIEGCIHHTTV